MKGRGGGLTTDKPKVLQQEIVVKPDKPRADGRVFQRPNGAVLRRLAKARIFKLIWINTPIPYLSDQFQQQWCFQGHDLYWHVTMSPHIW